MTLPSKSWPTDDKYDLLKARKLQQQLDLPQLQQTCLSCLDKLHVDEGESGSREEEGEGEEVEADWVLQESLLLDRHNLLRLN